MKKIKYSLGYHAAISALNVMPQYVRGIYMQSRPHDKRSLEMLDQIKKIGIPVKYLSKRDLDNLVEATNHQGVAVEVSYPGSYDESYLPDLVKKRGAEIFVLILDGIQDPHNLGACLRSANVFGVDAVIIPKNNACGLTPTVYKVASGAIGLTPIIQVTNLVRTIKLLQENNIWVYGATEEAAKEIKDVSLNPPLALVFGAEGRGLRRLTKESCDDTFKIPMRGKVENLNISVAAGISLYEVRSKK